MERKCNYCGDTIHSRAHGNRNYCSNECYYLAKLNRNKSKYALNNELMKKFIHIDFILESLYKIHGPNKEIPLDLFNNVEMNWRLYTATIKIDDVPVKVIRNYAYCLYDDKTVRIWKI